MAPTDQSSTPIKSLLTRLPEAVRYVLIATSILFATAAALAPLVFLLRRLGVG